MPPSSSSSSSSSKPPPAKKARVSKCPQDLKSARGELYTRFSRPNLPTIIVAALNVVQLGDVASLKDRMRRLRVGSIFNVTEEPATNAVKREVYDALNITYEHRPLYEDPMKPPKGDFFTDVGAFYVAHLMRSPKQAIVLHCRAGCNRSGIAAAALLWLTTTPLLAIDDVVTCMRETFREFIQYDTYIASLKLWAGEGRRTSRAPDWFGEGLKLRTFILRYHQRLR